MPVLKELDLVTDSKTKMYILLLEQGKIFLDVNNLQLFSSYFLNMNKICLSFTRTCIPNMTLISKVVGINWNSFRMGDVKDKALDPWHTF